jgi:hypothetical protein
MTVKTQIFYQTQRKTSTLSNLIEEFDANYNGGIGLNDSIIDLIETSKVDTPEVRRVSDETVFAVAERALTASALLPMDVQHFNVIREVTNFLTLASDGAISETVTKHSDLLPVNHPNSTAAHEFSVAELRLARAEWIAADPRIEDNSVRAIVAAVYGSNPNSLEFHYNLIRFNALSDQIPSDLKIVPLVAFGDPYAGKNSFWHRKQRAEAQRRDDEGQFAEMGGGARLYVRMAMGNIVSVVGKVAGIPENDPNGIDIEITDVPGITPGIYTVPSDKTHFFKAILPEEAIKKSSPVGPGLNVKYVDITDMVRKDLPTSWFESESGTTVPNLSNAVRAAKNYATGDGYRVSMYDGPSEALQNRVDEAKDKFGSLVVNTTGTDSLENDKPVYELISTKRGQEEVVGYAQDWAAIQAMAKDEDDNYPNSENEPITETKEPVAQLPEPEPEVPTEVLEEDPLDQIDYPSFDPYEATPNNWMPTLQNHTFLSNDGLYSAIYSDSVIGSEPQEDLNLETGLLSNRETAVPLSGVLNVYDEQTGNLITSAFNWEDAQRLIQSYENDEDDVLVDRMSRTSDQVASKTPVTLEDLDPKRYELLLPMSPEVAAKVEKDKTNGNYTKPEVGGFDAKLGTEGVDEGVLFPAVKNLFVTKSLWQDLLLRKQVPEAVDMYDEMMDHPEAFTIGQLVTLYHNLNNMYEDKGEKSQFTTYPRDREKIRRAIKNLDTLKVPASQYEHLQQKIEAYRFTSIKDAKDFLRELNDILDPYRLDQSRLGLTFKDKMKVSGKDIITTDAILDNDGTILEIVSISQDEDDPDSLDIYVKRGDKTAYYPLKKEDSVTVFRGTGVLPTPENLAQDAKIKKGISKSEAKSAETEIFDESGTPTIVDENDPRVTRGRKDPSEVKRPIQPVALDAYKVVLATFLITDPVTFYRLEDIIENPEMYEYWDAQNLVNKIKVDYARRPQGEYFAQKPLRDLLKQDLEMRDIPEEQANLIRKNLHTYSRATAEDLHRNLQNEPKRKRAAPSSTTTAPLPDTSARGVVAQRGEQDFRDSDFTVNWGGQELILSTTLIGPDAPTKETIAKAAQVINNYFVDADNPNTLKSFIELHRVLPKNKWKSLIETWGKPQFSKYDRPDIFRDALSEDQGGPRNRQLASVARSINKGVLPEYFTGWIMQEYKDKPLAWFAKVLDVVKVLENNYDRELLEFAMRNLKDVSDLRVPDNYPKIPDLYQPQEGEVVTPEDIAKYQARITGAFPEYMKRMYSNDPFWKNILPNILPTEAADIPEENKEEEIAKAIARAARLADARKTRRRMDKISRELAKAFDLSNRELSTDGKRFVQQAISELTYLRNALNGNRKNIIQDSPAEFDRRLKLITSALANKPVANSYGRLRNPNQSTVNKLEELASLVSTLTGTYKAGQDVQEDDVVVDKRRIFEAAVPQMKRFTPPAFDGPALEELSNLKTWEEVKDFLGKLDIYVFDFETTGIFDVNDPGIKNDPIQLAIAKTYNFAIQSIYNSYINPESKLSGFSLKTIGDGTGKKVTKEFLQSQRSKLQAMKDFLDTVPAGAVLLGHNGLMFDMEVLNRTLREAGLPEYSFGGFIDTYGLSSHVMPRWTKENPDAPFKLSDYGQYGAQKPSDSLESLVTYFGLSNNGRHEADADIISTLEILEKILDFAIAGRSERSSEFDFYGSKNGWSREDYEEAQRQYQQDVIAYTMARFSFNVSMAVQNLYTPDEDDQKGVSEEVINQILEIASRPLVSIEEDRTEDLPAVKIVKELGSSSYVVDNNTGRVGRSYGATGNGLVLAEFRAADYLATARKVLEKIVPSALYNATEALIVKGGKVLDYGMTVSHPVAGKESGVFQGFEDIKVGLIKVGNDLYRVPVKEISVLKYEGNDPASSQQVSKALSLLDDLEQSKNISSSFAKALRKTIDSDSYPSGSMADLISMLVNAKDQRNLVKANEDAPQALPASQSAASTATDEPLVDRRRKNPSKEIISAKDVEDVELDLSLIKKNMPKMELTDEVVTILKAVAATVDPKHKGKSLNKEHYNLVIRAYAGTGKTTTVEAVTYLLSALRPDDSFLYLVFGKENAEEAETRLISGNTFASTLHALAYNVKANKDLKAKFQKQPELTGNSEGLNVQYASERVAEVFGIYEQFAQAIKDKYGDNVDIPAQLLVEMAHDGLDKWAMSADREFKPEHFELLKLFLSERPSWGPHGETKLEPVDEKNLKEGDSVIHDKYGEGKFLRFEGTGKEKYGVFDFGDEAETKIPSSELKNLKVEVIDEGSKVEDFGDYLVPELTEIAQLFWEDITSPLDTSRPQLLVDFQHMVKNWSLGNVDFTATEKDSKGNAVSALGLERVPRGILLDEGQDMNPVFVDIMTRQATQYDNGIQIITVGDSNQSIFAFSGNVDALQTIPYDLALPLSKSYRAAPELLDPINFMLGILRAPDKLTTAIKDVGYIVDDNSLVQDNMWIISRTNAGILDAASDMEANEFFNGKPFAVTANFKRRMLEHISALQYLYEKYQIQSEINKIDAIFDEYLGGNFNLVPENQTEEEFQDEMKGKKAELVEKLKNKKAPANRPAVLIGATWEGLLKKSLEDKLDADTAIIFKLANKEKYVDSEGKPKKAARGPALSMIKKRLQTYRVMNKHVELPEEIGKAGYLGSNIAYVVKDGNLVIGDGGGFPKGKKPGDFGMGVLQNSKILESIGFVQTEELNPDTGYKKREWVRPLRESDQEYIDSVVREVYEALSGKDAKLTLMTGHTSKGLENEAVRLWKDWDPTYLGTSQSDVATSGEQPAKTKEQLEKEKNKIDEVLNRQEFNLYYTVISRAKRLLDMGGLGTLFKRQDFIDKMEQKIAEELGEIDNNPIVDKRVFKGQGDYYDSLNKSKVERAEAYIRSLNHSLGLARMERTVPFRYATDSDIDFERQSARRMIDDVEMNPDAERLKDQNNRSGLLEILAMIESGASIASLSDYDRQRLFAYLGSSSLGSSSALLDDPTEKIKGAIAELNRRLGIE